MAIERFSPRVISSISPQSPVPPRLRRAGTIDHRIFTAAQELPLLSSFQQDLGLPLPSTPPYFILYSSVPHWWGRAFRTHRDQ
eukprot:scaffold146264_cov31-Tisochrysis_lutea.AAC.1